MTQDNKRLSGDKSGAAKPRHGAKQTPRSAAKGKRRPAQVVDVENLFSEDQPPRPARKKKRRHRDEGVLAINLLLAAGIVALLALGGMLAYKHHAFEEMKRVVEAQTFYDGTSVEGVDLSGKTLSAALKYWQRKVEPRYSGRTVDIQAAQGLEAASVTAQTLGYESDYESVLYNAWNAGRRGSLEERYRAAVSRAYHPVAYRVTRSIYTDSALDAYVRTLSDRADTPAVDAAIESFDVDNYAFVLTESQPGTRLDAEGLKRDIVEALKAGGGSVTPVVETVEPAITKEDVNSEYGMIAFAVTNASSSSSNRIKNIQNAVGIINGTRVRDGETFSFNEVVGERTTARGFRRAPAYSGGEVTEEVGGGICQVSTTLFNAAVKSDMEIVERHNHSLTVAYVDRGKDAAVNWKSQDLKFTNHSGDDVYICCFVSEDKRVRFAIFGRLLPNGETITLEAKTTDTEKYDTVYEQSPFLMPGETKVADQGKNGYKAEAYKVRWDAQGNQLSKELLCKSVYKSRNEVIQFGA